MLALLREPSPEATDRARLGAAGAPRGRRRGPAKKYKSTDAGACLKSLPKGCQTNPNTQYFYLFSGCPRARRGRPRSPFKARTQAKSMAGRGERGCSLSEQHGLQKGLTQQ